jgi:exodeoxyribonuclease VII large subunit
MSDKKDDSILSVTDFTNSLKTVLLENFKQTLALEGEISNLKNSNGNCYFTLKDEYSSINAIMWNNTIDYVNGDNVVINGKLNLYNKNGSYNILVNKIKKVGLGDIYQAYEKKKELFLKKGYFDDTNKKKIKNNLKSIGIVTALNGAAIKDILYVLEKNKFCGEIFIKNCKVQGSNCAKSIVKGIEYFCEHKVDLILIARGGGSFEDLMGYSEDIVIESINKCPILTMSAVGHEVDTMLSDYVADIRAPTPSIAGEIICKYQKNNISEIYEYKNNLINIEKQILKKISNYKEQLKTLEEFSNSINIGDIFDGKINYLKELKSNYDNKIKTKLLEYKKEILDLENESNKFDNTKVLSKGYSVIIDENDNLVKTKVEYKNNCKNNIKMKIIFVDGEIFI